MSIDLCGSLPGYVVKKATEVQGGLVLTVRKFLAQKYAGKKVELVPMVNLPNGPLPVQAAPSASPKQQSSGLRARRSVKAAGMESRVSSAANCSLANRPCHIVSFSSLINACAPVHSEAASTCWVFE